MRKRLQNYIFLNRREEFWNIYCVLQFSIAFDLRSNDNIYRRNRTERSCFITSRWIEGQDLFVDNVNVLVLYLSRFVVAFFFLSSFLSYIVLILYSSNIIDYILSSHPEDKKQYDWIMKHWFALNSFVSTSFRLIKHNFLYSEATFDETLLFQSNKVSFQKLRVIHGSIFSLRENWSSISHDDVATPFHGLNGKSYAHLATRGGGVMGPGGIGRRVDEG